MHRDNNSLGAFVLFQQTIPFATQTLLVNKHKLLCQSDIFTFKKDPSFSDLISQFLFVSCYQSFRAEKIQLEKGPQHWTYSSNFGNSPEKPSEFCFKKSVDQSRVRLIVWNINRSELQFMFHKLRRLFRRNEIVWIVHGLWVQLKILKPKAEIHRHSITNFTAATHKFPCYIVHFNWDLIWQICMYVLAKLNFFEQRSKAIISEPSVTAEKASDS